MSTILLRLLLPPLCALLTIFPSVDAREELPLMDPIPEPIGWGDLALHLEHWLTVPATDAKAPLARINCMKPAPDGSGRLFLNDLIGPMYSIINDKITAYLDLRSHLPAFYNERGLAGGFNFFEFHPEFEKNGLFYTIHTEEPQQKEPDFIGPHHKDARGIDCIILEWRAQDPAAPVFKGNFREIMRVRFPTHIHFVQDMVFNPNTTPGDEDYGLLYIGVGEGGSMIAGQADNIHRLDSLLGNVIRIDPLGTNSANGNYGIPASNPWASDGDDQTLGELWAIGFRNPHRFAWDPDGRLFVTDIGEANVEEINLVEKGHSYGWPHREGTFEFQLDPNKFGLLPLPDNDEGYTYPIAQFDHYDADAISGGYFYRGSKHPLLKGKYVFGAIVRGHLFYLNAADIKLGSLAPIKKFRVFSQGTETSMAELADSGRVDLRIGIDQANKLYVFEKNKGQIFKIAKVTHSAKAAN
jgi:hypothetical protein